MSVQLRIRELEQKTRDALIMQENKAKAVGDKFWAAQQQQRYPNISENLLVSPTTEDVTLAVTNQESTTDYLTSIRDKLMIMTAGSSTMTEKVLQNINSKQALMYLDNHWDELKRFLKPMSKQLFSVDKLYLQIIKFLKLNQVIQTNKDANDGSYTSPLPSYVPPPPPVSASIPSDDDLIQFNSDIISREFEPIPEPIDPLDQQLNRGLADLVPMASSRAKTIDTKLIEKIQDLKQEAFPNARKDEPELSYYSKTLYEMSNRELKEFERYLKETIKSNTMLEEMAGEREYIAENNRDARKADDDDETNMTDNVSMFSDVVSPQKSKAKAKQYDDAARPTISQRKELIQQRLEGLDALERKTLSIALKQKYGYTISSASKTHDGLDVLNEFLEINGRGLYVPSYIKKKVAPPVKQTMQKSKKKFYGKGLTQTNIHPKLFVDLEHLKNNKLTIKYKSTGKISWSVQIPSPELKQVITDLILGRYDEKRYKKLSKEDKEYVDVFIARTKLQFEPIENEEQSLKNKFDVLVGELRAGNDNPTIRAMMIAVIERLFTLKKITKNKYLQMKDELVGV